MKKLVCLIIVIPILVAFGKNKKPVRSKYLPKSFVKVPQGKVYLSSRLDSCETFFISESEVTNGEYQMFLNSFRTEKNVLDFIKNVPDTTVWRSAMAYNEPYVSYYYQHLAYKDYPVVGVTLKQAQAYCKWLSKNYTAKKQGKVEFFIPTKKQWIRAARGGSTTHFSNGNTVRQNADKKNMGLVMYNHKTFGSRNIRYNVDLKKYEFVNVDGEISDGGFITTPVNSYWPNQFGLYNMCGNVAELVADNVAMGGSWNNSGYDIRVESEQKATNPTATIGFRVCARLKSL